MGSSRRRAALAAAAAVVITATLAACGASPAPVDSGPTCRSGWVAFELGGCGPAVALCGPGGGAARGACDSIDRGVPRTEVLADGGIATHLYRTRDGSVGGGWPEPGDPREPPPAAWRPDAGIPSCPADWSRLADGTCDPRLRAACPPSSGPLPGDRCTPTTDTECPPGDYAEPGPESMGAPRLHVRADADPAIADGTTSRPFARVSAALAAAAPDTWILVAAGAYPERLTIAARVHIVGVCAARVTFSADDTGAAIRVDGTAAVVDLRGLAVRGGHNGIEASGAASVRLARVRVTQARARGVYATGAATNLTADGLFIDDVRPETTGARGRGVQIERGAFASLAALSISRASEAGLAVYNPGTVVRVTDSLVADTRATVVDGAEDFGEGVGVFDGARVTLERVALVGNHESGAIADHTGSELVATDVVIVRTRPLSNFDRGVGATIQAGARLSATRVLASESSLAGFEIRGAGTRATVTDSVVQRTSDARRLSFGRGLAVSDGATVTVERSVFDANESVGIYAQDPETTLDVRQSRVSRTQPSASVPGTGIGVQSARGARVSLAFCSIVGDTVAAVSARDGGVVRAERCVLADVVGPATLGGAAGAFVQGGGTLALTSCNIDAAASTGILADGAGSFADVTDCDIRGTRTRDDDNFGFGVQAGHAAHVRIARSRIVANTTLAVNAADVGTHVDLDETAVVDTRPSRFGFGYGVLAQTGAAVALRRTWMQAPTTAGVYAADETTSVSIVDSFIDHVRGATGLPALGVLVSGAASANITRTAVLDTSGMAVGAIGRGTSMVLSDVFVRRVTSARLVVTTSAGSDAAPAAHGLHVDDGAVLQASQCVLDAGGFGLFAVDGRLTLRGGVVSRQLDAAAGFGTASGPSPLDVLDVAYVQNAQDRAVAVTVLPRGAALPTPTPVETPR